MSLLNTTYTLAGENRSPRAYLEGLRELLAEEIDSRQQRISTNTTQIERRSLQGEIRGLELATTHLDRLLAGLTQEEARNGA